MGAFTEPTRGNPRPFRRSRAQIALRLASVGGGDVHRRMPADNVTPFRRPPKRPPAPQQTSGFGLKTHRGKAVLVHLLTLGAFGLNFFFPAPPLFYAGVAVAVAGGVVAYSSRGQGMPWVNTHHEHALRTLMIGYAIWTLGSMLTYINPVLAVGTLVVQIAVVIWAAVRAAIALALAVTRRPIPNPTGWLV